MPPTALKKKFSSNLLFCVKSIIFCCLNKICQNKNSQHVYAEKSLSLSSEWSKRGSKVEKRGSVVGREVFFNNCTPNITMLSNTLCEFFQLEYIPVSYEYGHSSVYGHLEQICAFLRNQGSSFLMGVW